MPPPTWPEARAAKAERQRREARYFHPGNTSKRRCRACGMPMSKAAEDRGERVHPTCAEPKLMREQHARDLAALEGRRAAATS